MAGARHDYIDGLRAVAVAGVLAFHCAPTALPGGFAGVDVFFVISGFLISRIIVDGVSAGTFRFGEFFARRVRRIFPALLLVLITTWGLGWCFLFAHEYQSLGKHITAGAGFSANFLSWHEVGYFDTEAAAKPLLHLWSLGIEEQFYLLWPGLVALAWRVRLRPIVAIAIVLAVSLALALIRFEAHPTEAFYGPHVRIWEIALGALLAELAPRLTEAPRVRSALSFGGAFLVAMSFVCASETAFPGMWALAPTIGTVFLLAGGVDVWVSRVVLARRPMVLLGRISYPLYLWHWPLLAFLHLLGGDRFGLNGRLVVVAISLVAAALTYRFVEVPLQAGPPRRVLVLILLAAMAGVGFVGHRTFAGDGFPGRGAAQVMAASDDYVKLRARSCHETRSHVSDNVTCEESWNTFRETLLVVGDSHANPVATALMRKAATGEMAQNVLVFYKATCAPLLHYSIGAGSCDVLIEEAIAEVARDSRVTTVILVARWGINVPHTPYPFEVGDGGIPDGPFVFHDDARRVEGRAAFAAATEATLAALEPLGVRVVWVDQVPDWGFSPSIECTSRLFSDGRGCGRTLVEIAGRQADYRRLVDGAVRTHANVIRIDPVPLFCADGYCTPRRDGVILYKDDDHVNAIGSALVVERLLARLAELPPVVRKPQDP